MASNSYDYHSREIKHHLDKNTDYKRKLKALHEPRDARHDSRTGPPGKLSSTYTPRQKNQSSALKALREKNTKVIGVGGQAQKRDAAVIEPFYSDIRNVFISNLVRQYSIPTKNRMTVNNNMIAFLIFAGVSWYAKMIDKFLLVQSAYTLVDLSLETLPTTYQFRDAAMGGGLASYYKLL